MPTNAGIVVHGFTQLNRALERIDGGKANFGIAYELQARLKRVGEATAKASERFITHKYPSHSTSDRLEGSNRVSVTKTRATVYSTSAHGGAQQFGAWSKGRGPHIRRANASRWQSKGVEAEKERTKEEMDGLIDWLVDEFHRDI